MTDQASNAPSTDAVFADATKLGDGAETMITLDGVVKRYGDFTALNNINLNVGRQEVVVVI